MKTAEPRTQKLETIQICRGIAAIFILLFHSTVFISSTSPLKIFDQGSSGVVFFFLLSGFIIYFTRHTDFGAPDKAVVYLKKRLIRIYPIYWVYLAGTILISYTVFLIFQRHIVETTELNIVDIAKNIVLYPYYISPYHTEYVRYPIISQAWTLSFEILFYLTFIMFIVNSRLGFLFHMAWFFCILLSFVRFITPGSFTLKFILNPEIILFFMGMSMAHLVLRHGTDMKRFALPILGTGLTCLLMSWLLNTYGYIDFFKVHRLFTYGIPYSLIILGSVLWERSAVAEATRGRLFSLGVLLGDASYSIFLVHFLTLSFIYRFFRFTGLMGLNESMAYVVASGATVMVGLLCYQFLEKPLFLKMQGVFLQDRDKPR